MRVSQPQTDGIRYPCRRPEEPCLVFRVFGKIDCLHAENSLFQVGKGRKAVQFFNIPDSKITQHRLVNASK